jgi:transcriptional regulator GlxA family with amidase domain
MRALAREILDLSRRSPRPDRPLSMRALALVHGVLGAVPEEDLVAPRVDPRVAAALARLERGPFRLIPNPVLAHEAQMSTNAFLRLFKAAVGRSPQAHSKVMRIRQACMLLHYSNEGIKEIAEAIGFCDRYHFSRVFKKVRGVSPAQFRRRAEFERASSAD